MVIYLMVCVLLQTLCEIKTAMLERGLKQKPNITRHIMGREMPTIADTSFRKLRDWIIFRDSMNCLEYVIELFEYFKQKLMTPCSMTLLGQERHPSVENDVKIHLKFV